MSKILAFFYQLLRAFSQKPPVPELPQPGENRKIRLGLIVGHEKSAPGAPLHGTNDFEYQYNSKLAELIKKEGDRMGTIETHIIFRDGVGISGAYKKAEKLKCDCVVELHFNAFNGRVSGTETLCSPDLTDVEFAQIMQNAICRLFQRDGQSRGVKSIARSARGGQSVYGFPNGVNCLVEPFFGDEPTESKRAREMQVPLANTIAGAVHLWGVKKDLV